MFERLSKSAKAAVTAGCMEAATVGEPATDDVHLLIGCSMGRSDGSAILKGAGATRARLVELLDGFDNDGFDDEDVRALSTVGIDFARVAASVEDIFGAGALDAPSPSQRRGPTRRAVPLGPTAKQALARSLSEAINRGARRIETTHLLLGVLHDPGPRCRAVTLMLDLDYDTVRTLVDNASTSTNP